MSQYRLVVWYLGGQYKVLPAFCGWLYWWWGIWNYGLKNVSLINQAFQPIIATRAEMDNVVLSQRELKVPKFSFSWTSPVEWAEMIFIVSVVRYLLTTKLHFAETRQHSMLTLFNVYTLYTTQYTLKIYTIHYTKYAWYGALYTIHSTSYTVHNTIYTVPHIPYNIHYTHYTIYSTLYTVIYIQYTINYKQYSSLLSRFCCFVPFTNSIKYDCLVAS